MPETVTIDGVGEVRLDDLLETSDTIAFLVIKNDIILYERYLQGHTQSALSQAFSTSKSIQSILIGIAIDDGHITSVDQPVTDFVPELHEGGFDSVSIKDLLQMKSSMDYEENDNPFGEHVRFNPELPISNRLDQGNAPSSTRAIVVLLTNAVNLPIKLTNPSSGVLNWCSMGSGGGFHYVCTRFELPQARTSPLVAPLHL